jgi:hypothetical protein
MPGSIARQLLIELALRRAVFHTSGEALMETL